MSSNPYSKKPLHEAALLEFLLAYFHPDWSLDDVDEAAVVERFLSEAGVDEVTRLADDLDEVLVLYSDPEVRALIQRHLVNVRLGDRSSEEWLSWLRRRIQASRGSG